MFKKLEKKLSIQSRDTESTKRHKLGLKKCNDCCKINNGWDYSED